MSALDLFKLDDKVAIVTGGAKGIGLFYSEALAEAGARVVMADIDPKAVGEAGARLAEEHPGRVIGIELDVSSRSSIEAMVAEVGARWGRLDILVNNAAVFSVLPSRPSAWEIADEEWDQVMAVNVRGVYACTEVCLDLMKRDAYGRVINIASGLAFKGSPALIHYAASKGAVVNLTRSMATELGPAGITVNAIAPGATDSPTVLAQRAARGLTARRSQRILDRDEVPADLLGTLIYLSSPASEFVTGQTIVVDGGSYLH
ncbi:MAG TPA: SDR family oxidoreductase [Dehalococcoidia bacterium]|nr:SDR family oxidoreductase [Dehalococcoidia bacterium]